MILIFILFPFSTNYSLKKLSWFTRNLVFVLLWQFHKNKYVSPSPLDHEIPKFKDGVFIISRNSSKIGSEDVCTFFVPRKWMFPLKNLFYNRLFLGEDFYVFKQLPLTHTVIFRYILPMIFLKTHTHQSINLNDV